MNYSNFIIFLHCAYLVVSVTSLTYTEYVPVLIWDSSETLELKPSNYRVNEVTSALKPMSQDTFQKLLTERLGKNVPVLVFAEENLSLEDFSLYDEQGKSALNEMSTIKTHDLTYLPFVKSPMSVIKALPNRNLKEMSISSLLNDNDVLDENTIVVVNMNDATDGEDRIDMLKRHDETIVEVNEKLFKTNKDFVLIFTGYHSSWSSPQETASRREIRDTTAAVGKKIAVNGSIAFIAENAILFIKDSPILFNNATNITLDNLEISSSLVNDSELHVELSNGKITLDIFVVMDESYWSIANVSVDYKENPEKNYMVRVRDVYAPLNWSYHCSGCSFTNIENAQQKLEFPGFQFQPFNTSTTNNSTFGEAYDCVSFMTIPILSGIFVTIILAIIMTFGLTIIMSIKTMDRFDDPKGKTITISATD